MLKFDINILWTFINLIILFLLMKAFLFKPIKKTIDKRRELIDNQFREAEEKEESAQQLYDSYQAKLSCAEDEKNKIISDARADAKNEYDKIISKAQNDADKIKSDAKRLSEIESEKARLAVREEIAEIAMAAAEKVVGQNISPSADSDIYDKFLSESSDE